jgi:hypothetical protein
MGKAAFVAAFVTAERDLSSLYFANTSSTGTILTFSGLMFNL